MALPRHFILSLIFFMGYSQVACSQTQDETGESSVQSEEAVLPSIGDADDAPELGVNPDNMNGEKLAALVQQLDEEAVVNGNSVIFKITERELMMVYDSGANRMRIISPIIPVAALPEGMMERMLQANYDAVLDARYAVANDLVWSVFIHPLSSLTEDDFISALAQTVTAAETFGSSFTSGAVVFGGGDSSGIHEGLLEELKKAQKARSDI